MTVLDVQFGHAYGGFALDVGFVTGGRTLALFGPSGSGKSTILEAIAGLRRLDRARVVLGERVLTDRARGVDLAPRHRRVGLVLQDGLLFPLLTVRQNLLFGAPPSPRLGLERVTKLLEIDHLLDRSPRGLSGGERQRVALGRAVLSQPELLLCDEPFAALDVARRRRLVPILARITAEFDVPLVFVTHDVSEVLALADEVVVIDQGEVVTQGPPQALLDTLAKDDTSALNYWEGAVDVVEGTLAGVRVADRTIIYIALEGAQAGDHVRLDVPLSAVTLAPAAPDTESARNHLRGKVTAIVADAGVLRVTLDAGVSITALITPNASQDLGLQVGQELVATFKATAINVLSSTRTRS